MNTELLRNGIGYCRQVADTTRHYLTNHDGEIVQVFEPQLDDL